MSETKTEPKAEKPKQKARPRLVAVIGIDADKRYEPGDSLQLPDPVRGEYLRAGKVREESK